jgi:hypothetical protein
MTKAAIPVAIVIGLAAAWWMSRSRPPAAQVPAIAPARSNVGERTATTSGPPPLLGNAAEAPGGAPQGPPPRARDPRPLVRDPRKPGYDAGRLYELRLNDAAGIFQAEPRDADFYLVFNESIRGDDGFRAQRDTTCAKYRDDWKQQAPRR